MAVQSAEDKGDMLEGRSGGRADYMYIICGNAGEFHEIVYSTILVKRGETSVSTFLNCEFRHFRYNSNYLPQIQVNSLDMSYVLNISIYRTPRASIYGL